MFFWSRKLLICLRIYFSLYGFVIKPSAPQLNAIRTSSVAERAVTRKTGISHVSLFALICLQSSYPFISGITTSLIINVGLYLSNNDKACLPSNECLTIYPFPSRIYFNCSACVILSSTIRIVAGADKPELFFFKIFPSFQINLALNSRSGLIVCKIYQCGGDVIRC